MILNTKVSLWIRNKTECLVGIPYVSCICSTVIDVSSEVNPSIPQAFLVITTSIHKCKSFTGLYTTLTLYLAENLRFISTLSILIDFSWYQNTILKTDTDIYPLIEGLDWSVSVELTILQQFTRVTRLPPSVLCADYTSRTFL